MWVKIQSRYVSGFQIKAPATVTEVEAVMDPSKLLTPPMNGNPMICPRIGSFLLVAFLCQSEALLANVAQEAAASRVKRTINQALVDPETTA